MSTFAFIGPSYTSQSVNADCQRAFNLFPEAIESGTGKNVAALLGTPGLALFDTLPTLPVRGLWAGEGRLFAAGGSKLYEVFVGGTHTELGDIGDDATHTPVQMFPNGGQLFVVSAGKAYLANGVTVEQCRFTGAAYTDLVIDGADNKKITSALLPFTADEVGSYINVTGGTGFTVQVIQIVSVVGGVATANVAVGATGSTGGRGNGFSYVTARTGAFLDGYFIAAKPDSKQFNISDLNDGQIWDPLDFFTKESYPDNIAAIIADHEELWLFGTHHSIEVWRNEGDANYTFQRDPGAAIHGGCVAPWSPVSLGNNVFWLGGDTRGGPVAYRAAGFQPVRVSNHAIEAAWRRYTTVADAIGYAYVDQGHSFWVLTFPTADATWVFDLATGYWHERGWRDPATGLDHRHRGRCHAYVFGKHFVGDWENGKIYEMSLDLYADAGAAIKRIRTASHISNEQIATFFHRFQLDAEGGLGLNPVLDWSDNGGHTWENPRTTRADALGDYGRRFPWWRLGSAFQRAFRVTIIGTVKVTLINACLEATQGLS